MLLHLGSDQMVSAKHVIAIINLENSEISKDTLAFLQTAKEEGFIKNISEDKPKSFIVAEVNNKTIIYYSPISSNTLLKRMGFINRFKNK